MKADYICLRNVVVSCQPECLLLQFFASWSARALFKLRQNLSVFLQFWNFNSNSRPCGFIALSGYKTIWAVCKKRMRDTHQISHASILHSHLHDLQHTITTDFGFPTLDSEQTFEFALTQECFESTSRFTYRLCFSKNRVLI